MPRFHFSEFKIAVLGLGVALGIILLALEWQILVLPGEGKPSKEQSGQLAHQSHVAMASMLPFELVAPPMRKIVTQNLQSSTQAPTDSTDSLQFRVIEEMPSFPGGDEGVRNYIARNLKKVSNDGPNPCELVYVRMIVNESGKVTQPSVMRGCAREFNEAALEVVRNMPDWKPARNRGETLPMQMIIPVRF
ncbi:MAG: energy transducer TonB [Salibacteraceae bacterium]